MRIILESGSEYWDFELPEDLEAVVNDICRYFSFTAPEAVRYLLVSGARWVEPRLEALRTYLTEDEERR